jgi:hypothetical protein
LKGFSFFITENLAVNGEDNEENEKSFFPHRDLNANINIARRAMSSAGWGRCESPEPANEAGGAKPRLNAGSLILQGE